MDRVILHCDMNNFFASVELLDFPHLADFPVAISGSSDQRHGIILAKNGPAKDMGVVTAETIWQAKKKCKDLILLPPHREKYVKYSKLINEIYLNYTDLVEPFSIDESWLDVTNSQKLLGSGEEIANEIRKRVKEELGLTLSAGVSFNKVFAKMGSEYKKPDATTVITRGNYKDILWPMKAEELFFVGKSTAEKLSHIGILTIGDLANSSKTQLGKILGKHGLLLHDYANGKDSSPVSKFSQRDEVKSVGNGTTFSHDLTTLEEVSSAVTMLSDSVASRLRRRKLLAKGVKVDIKDPSFKTISRQMQLDQPTNLAQVIKKAALEIIEKHWRFKKKSDVEYDFTSSLSSGKTLICNPIRLISITGINLTDEEGDVQLSFFQEPEDHKDEAEIEKTMDEIRKKFGNSSIGFGIGKDL